ncbi:hypothetical protein SeLEV6574_g07858 [Synchytrium endobioticum]|uniref:Uncharacterized protein n=1 Tax=Synchytrium endobioticum TaxID=286115 RepID=A0A507C8A5_9FUNG|nr:hypothetical protein SeLEV6574_g07858 [Synchytrium endobioticum]
MANYTHAVNGQRSYERYAHNSRPPLKSLHDDRVSESLSAILGKLNNTNYSSRHIMNPYNGPGEAEVDDEKEEVVIASQAEELTKALCALPCSPSPAVWLPPSHIGTDQVDRPLITASSPSVWTTAPDVIKTAVLPQNTSVRHIGSSTNVSIFSPAANMNSTVFPIPSPSRLSPGSRTQIASSYIAQEDDSNLESPTESAYFAGLSIKSRAPPPSPQAPVISPLPPVFAPAAEPLLLDKSLDSLPIHMNAMILKRAWSNGSDEEQPKKKHVLNLSSDKDGHMIRHKIGGAGGKRPATVAAGGLSGEGAPCMKPR